VLNGSRKLLYGTAAWYVGLILTMVATYFVNGHPGAWGVLYNTMVGVPAVVLVACRLSKDTETTPMK